MNIICNISIDDRKLDTAEVVKMKIRDSWGKWGDLITHKSVRDILGSQVPTVVILKINDRRHALYSKGALPYVNEDIGW